MPSQVITRELGQDAPQSYQLTNSEVLTPSAVFANFDGSGAGGAFLPCVSYYTPDGKLFARAFPDESVAAGESAGVSWFPGLAKAVKSSGGLTAASGIYKQTGIVIADGGSGQVNGATLVQGADLLTFSGPVTTVNAGFHAITLYAQPQSLVTGGHASVSLTPAPLVPPGVAVMHNAFPLDAVAGGELQGGMAAVAYTYAAGQTITMQIEQTSGGALTFTAWVWVTRLS